jgi:hypothetical protein
MGGEHMTQETQTKKIPDFNTLVKRVETLFRERDIVRVVYTLAEIAKHYDYYIKVDPEDVILAFYDLSAYYNEPPHSLYVTIVLRSGVALKISVDKEKNSNEIAMFKAWVVSVE